MDMKQYYEFRQEVRKLYDSTYANSSDLCSKLLELKDKNKYIVSMSIDLSNYYIDIDLDDSVDEATKNSIADQVVRRIGYYISNNQDSLNLDESEYTIGLFISDPKCYCDLIIIQNSIRINL